MKLLNFSLPDDPGRVRAALWHAGRAIPLAALVPAFGDEPLRGGVYGNTIGRIPEVLSAIAALPGGALDAAPAREAGTIRFEPPVVGCSTFRDFYGFEQHVRAARKRRGLEMVPEWYEFPAFYFSNADNFVGHDRDIPMPPSGIWLDFELEVAAIVGRAGRDIDPADAESYIAGFTVLNDWSLRDIQQREMKIGLGPAKGKDFASSLGPFLVTPDGIAGRRRARGYDLSMVARVNGQEVSRANWDSIHYGFGDFLARASRGVTLRPGDVIGSGTCGTGCLLELGPEVIGRWLAPGDVVELEIEGLGLLRNRIVEPPAGGR